MSLLQCSPDLSCAKVLSVLLPHLAGAVVEDLGEAGGAGGRAGAAGGGARAVPGMRGAVG